MEAWCQIGGGKGCGQGGWGYKGALGIKDLVRLCRAGHLPLQTEQRIRYKGSARRPSTRAALR